MVFKACPELDVSNQALLTISFHPTNNKWHIEQKCTIGQWIVVKYSQQIQAFLHDDIGEEKTFLATKFYIVIISNPNALKFDFLLR